MKNALLLLAFLLTVAACQKNEFVTHEEFNVIPEEIRGFEDFLSMPPDYFSYRRTLPNYLQIMGLAPKPEDNAKASLGRVLFYDKNLSLDQKVSCASCHKQNHAFSDNVAVSTGIYGLKGTRNSMPLANVASFSGHYSPGNGITPLLLWDQRAANVAQQSTLAFLNDHEMGMTLQGVVARIQAQPYYPLLWKKVYGNFEVKENQVLECLDAFVGAIGSHNAVFDKALEQVNGNMNTSSSQAFIINTYTGDTISTTTNVLPGMTVSETRGLSIFVANCSKCHSPIRSLQEVFEACNGLDLNYLDQGKGQLTGSSADNGVFKAPSLRNIQLTAPYMHDGRFAFLEQVVDFYSDGVKNHANLHPLMLHNGSTKLNFTNTQRNDLVAFLKTLTDFDVVYDGRFSNPFRQ